MEIIVSRLFTACIPSSVMLAYAVESRVHRVPEKSLKSCEFSIKKSRPLKIFEVIEF